MSLLKKTTAFILAILIAACAAQTDFEIPLQNCTSLRANTSFAELEALFMGETLKIEDDLILEGYVTSSDKDGNFFSVLHIQDHPVTPTRGLQLEVDLHESHLLFDAGRKILIKLKGLYLGKSAETLKLGGTFTAFGNISVGRLPALKIPEHLFVACGPTVEVQSTLITIPEADTLMLSTLVRFEGLEIIAPEVGTPFALPEEETERTLTDCQGNEIILLNSGFSDFHSELLPNGNGTITGVLLKDKNDYQIAIRTLEDIDFDQESCPEIITEFTSNQIFISELADPQDNTKARFVELYNDASKPLDLNNWTLQRYTDSNTTVSSPTINLSGIIINAKSTLVISSNNEEFKEVYGFASDLNKSGSSPANSNGDDTIELVDPFGTVIDIFGFVGEDGTGTDHDFENGRAARKENIIKGNATYTASEWIITQPLNSPIRGEELEPETIRFTPGERK